MPPIAHNFRHLCFLVVACCAFFGRESADAQEPLEVKSAVAGFGGVYKAGYWTQILVEVKAGPAAVNGRLNLLTEDGDGVPVIFPAELAEPLELKAGETKTVRLYGKAGPQRSRWQLQLITLKGEPLWSTRLDVPEPQRSTREMLVTIGPAPGFAEAAGMVKRPTDVAFLVAPVAQASELPDRVWGYEGVERVVLVIGEKSIFDELSAQQLETLHQWVRLGGKLLFSIGERSPDLLQPDLPWAKLIPGKFAGLDPLRETTQLREKGGAELTTEALSERRPQVVKLTDITGRVDVHQSADTPPFVYRQAYGFGQVTFVAFALDHPTLTEWKGHVRFLFHLLGGDKPENLSAAQNRSITHLGYDDLIGQLRAVLDQFPGVTVVSFTAVAMVAVALLLLIGPVDYFVLKHFQLPRAVTWITFPSICVAVAAGTWYLGQLAHGTATRVNQVELIDIDAAQGIVRGTLWSHLYSPTGRTWQMKLQVADQKKAWKEIDGVADWQGLPGSGLGGLASPQIALDATNPYMISPPGKIAVIDSLPVRTASSKALAARWWSRTDLTKDLPPLTTNQYGHLQGEIVNPFPFKLTECQIASGEWLYRILELRPGQRVKVETLDAFNLEARLARRSVVDTKDLSVPWKSDDTDLPRIMQMLMLHNAVKGPTYTGMSHRYQPQIDMTDHLRFSRAILTGQADVSAAALQLEGVPAGELQQQQWIWYRLVLPVQPRDAATSNQP